MSRQGKPFRTPTLQREFGKAWNGRSVSIDTDWMQMSESDWTIVTVRLVVEPRDGEEAQAHLFIESDSEAAIAPAERIASEARLPVSELPGRRFQARRSSGGELYDFHLLNDPRI